MSRIVVVLLVAVLLAGCFPIRAEYATQVPPSDGPAQNGQYAPQPGDENLVREDVYIDSAEIYNQKSFPPQFRLSVKGSLPTPCHQLRAVVKVNPAEGRVDVEMYSLVSPAQACLAALEPFDAVIALDVPAGSFDVYLNDALVGSLVMPAAD